jgi:hypothetical protein
MPRRRAKSSGSFWSAVRWPSNVTRLAKPANAIDISAIVSRRSECSNLLPLRSAV